jgi:peptidoglycan/LPS O-acetylase OafA/YrhL
MEARLVEGRMGERRVMPELTALRAAAALLIVLFHAWYRYGEQVSLEGAAVPLLRHGWIAVDLFFVLSGFLLATPFLRERGPTWGRFMGRRLLRIAPPYYVALGLAAVLPYQGAADVNLLNLAVHASYLHGFVPGSLLSLNPVFWTLAVEVQFYLVLPLMARLLSGRHAAAAFLGMAAVTFATRAWAWPHVAAQDAWGVLDLALPAFLLHFAVGVAAARVVASGWTAPRSTRLGLGAAALALAAGGLALVPAGSYSQGVETFASNLLTRPALAVASGLLLLALRSGPLPQAVSWRPVQAVGTWSYSLYLVHMPLFLLLDGPLAGNWASATVGPLGLLPYMAFLTVASLAAAALFFRLVEHPVLEARDRIEALRRRDRSPAPAPSA